jgi:glycerol-3-phosphate acyltransferase PlsY
MAAYLVGAVPFGLVLGKILRGTDIREHGSRNLGATNAMRVLGAPIGGLVFALDFAKGWGPVQLAPRLGTWTASPGALDEPSLGWCSFAAGIAAVLGHVFPVYLGFRGGKGVATGAGVLAALAPLPTAISIGVFAVVVGASRWVSLGSIAASISLPATLVIIERESLSGRALPALVAALAIAAVVLMKHRANLARILAGTEARLGEKGGALATGSNETTKYGDSAGSPGTPRKHVGP